MIKIDQVATLLGFGEDPTESAKGEARIILKAFGVKGIDVEKKPGEFGKPAKVYDEFLVGAVAESIRDFKEDNGF